MSATHGKQKNVFAKYGHTDCSMSEEENEVWKRYPGTTTCAKIRRCWVSLFIVSEDMCRSISSHLKSHGAVVKEQERQLNQNKCIIHPYSRFSWTEKKREIAKERVRHQYQLRFYWDLVMIVVSYIQLFATPLDVMVYLMPRTYPAFNSTYFLAMRMGMDLTCVLDVILNFFTGYYDERRRKVMFRLKPIAKKYLKGYFTVDVLASLPTHLDLFMELPREGWTFIALGWLSLLKLLRYVILEKLYTKVCNIKRVNYYVRQSTFVAYSITLFWLIVTSLNFFARASTATAEARLKYYEADQEGALIYKRYSFIATNLYNGAILIYNIQYGTYEPKSTWNYVNVIFFWILSRVILIYILGRVMDLMITRTAAKRKYQRITLLLSEYMRHKGLPLVTQAKIIQFYEYHYQKSYYNEKEIMTTISGQLRQELVMHNCRQLVENVKFFKSLPLVVLVRIISFLHSETYMTNDVICRCNTVGNCMYFISAGTVAVYTKSGKEICHLHEGDYFGEVALVTDNVVRVATVLAVEVCEVYRLERPDFIRAIHPYPDLLQMIKKVAYERREDALEIDVKYRREHYGAV